jgi:hypothetical protein
MWIIAAVLVNSAGVGPLPYSLWGGGTPKASSWQFRVTAE